MKSRTLKQIVICAILLPLMSCGGGSGGSGVSSDSGGAPYIYAELDSFPADSQQPNFNSASVYIIDSTKGTPITNAVVTINGTLLDYNTTQQEYQGNPKIDQGESVNLNVTVNGNTYDATGAQFTSYPTITLPTSGTTWQATVANTFAWSGGTPITNSFYGVGVLDADDGHIIWPSGGYLQEVLSNSNTYSIPSSSLSVGTRILIAGIATSFPITDAATGSSFFVSGFNSIPITVADGSGTHWTRRQAAWSTDDFRSVTWSGTKFVTVGSSSGHILTSPDGATWTQQIFENSNPLNGVAWSGNQFVAVGSSGTILASPDGVTWTSRYSGTTASLSDVIWAGNRFIAIGTSYSDSTGYSNVVLTSADGVSWTATYTGTNNYLARITWSGSLFVAVGGQGNSGSPYTNIILTSTDGITWTQRIAGISDPLRGVTWSGTQFVIVGMKGSVLTSPDGITWTVRTSGTTAPLSNVAWSGLKFVAVGGGGASDRTILTSSDGVTWEMVTPDLIYPLSLYDIIWSGTRFVAVGEGGAIFSSP